ncbi:oil body-associated protein 2A-like [Solanum dulcamara]|uniref:oil body-associated protein 2A-like n=1 Tax=Solanum dulcamara TaxID=45834 RepID=UPI00248633A7|nr:oil body-associated protein 2A-like [Solanum dulcamara]
MASTTKSHEQVPPGEPMLMGQHMLDKGAQMLQSLKPIKQMNQHVCIFIGSLTTFVMYNHNMSRQIETHYYVTRVNQDFLQCAVYDSDESTGRLIRVEYIESDRIFESLPQEEQKLWHSHGHEVCDKLPIGPPSLMMSPQAVDLGIVKIGLVKKRDDKYNISTDAMKTVRADLPEPTQLNPRADYWVEHGKGSVIDFDDVEMKKIPPFP